MLQSPSRPDMETILAALVNGLAGLKDQVYLVLDDYHNIQSAAVDQQVAFFLDHLPANADLAILTL